MSLSLSFVSSIFRCSTLVLLWFEGAEEYIAGVCNGTSVRFNSMDLSIVLNHRYDILNRYIGAFAQPHSDMKLFGMTSLELCLPVVVA